MMRRALVVLATLLFALALPTPAHACPFDKCPELGDGSVVVGDVEDAPGGKIALNEPDPIYEWRLVNPCIEEDGNLGGCTTQPSCNPPPDRIVHNFLIQSRERALGPTAPWQSLGIECVDITDIKPTVTPEMVQAAFEELPLPLGEISLQPADSPVLVNLGAIFYTTQPEDAPYDVVILGQDVHIDAFIVDYAWHVGDGSPDVHGRGGPYPDKSTLHVYTAPGGYTVTLTLTWDATYSIDGGPETPVLDTTTTDSPPVTLTVVEAESILVDAFD